MKENSITTKKVEIETTLKPYTREEIMATLLEYFNGDVMASEVWLNKYCLKNSKGELFELSPVDMHRRMAKEFFATDSKYNIDLNGKSKSLSVYGQNRKFLTEEKIFEYFDKFKYIIPQGSVMASLGNPFVFASLSNCIVLPEVFDSYGGIMYSDQQLSQLMKRRCGVGIDISTLRPSESEVSNFAGSSTGAVSFMERFSNTTREVAQSGRRGALMITIDVNHPDVEHFAIIKHDLKKVTGANISIKLSDEFMNAVKKDENYTLRFPVNSKNPIFTKVVKAKELWNTIVSSARNNAEPGLIFWDKQHFYSTSSLYPEFKNISTNPCITDDSWIMTNNGAYQVKDLIGMQFSAVVDGKEYLSTDEGFYCTGKKKIYEITTNEGITLKATANHPLKKVVKLNRYKKETDWVEVSNLKVGDLLNINNHNEFSWTGSGNKEVGWLLGSLLGDGNICNGRAKLEYWGETKMELKEHAVKLVKNNIKYREGFLGKGTETSVDILERDKTSFDSTYLTKEAEKYNLKSDKILYPEIEKTSSDFYKGFLSGWFDADGTVSGTQKKGVSVRLWSTILSNLQVAQRMLLRIGIVSTIYENRSEAGYKKMPDGKGGSKEYLCKSGHELVISNENIIIFRNIVGFFDNEKSNKLNNLINSYGRKLNRERFVVKIKEIKEIGEELVYDCTVPEISEFDANGLSVHNCAEIAMGADSCRLIAINLFGCVKNPFSPEAEFDYEKFYEVTYEAQRLMDDLVDLELECVNNILKKIDADPEPDFIKETERKTWQLLYDNGKNGRRTGLGFTALADTIAALGFKFDSNESIKVVDKIMKAKCEAEFDSSIDMAIERGKFVVFDTKIEEKSDFVQMLKKELPHVYERMMKHGRRNVSISTVAPNGSLSMIAQTSSGVEPVFMLSYKRRRKINPSDKDAKIDFVDEMGDKWQENDVFHEKLKLWKQVTGKNDLAESPYAGATAPEISWLKRVEMQAVVQKYTTHSISSTINLPEETTVENVSDIYMKSWEMGLKGITVYRAGSRSGVLISNEEKKKIKTDKYFSENNAPKRPKILDSDVIRFTNNGEKWIGFIGMMDGRPYEVFTGKIENFPIPSTVENGKTKRIKVINKKGEKVSKYNFIFVDKNGDEVVVEGLNNSFDPEYWNYAKLVSGILRHGMPLPYAVDLISGLNLADDNLNTWKAGVCRMIKKYIKDGTKAADTKCSDCGDEHGLVFEEGCLHCKSCGSSKCG